MRAPDRGWKFKDPGLHRFIAFAIESDNPLNLSQMEKPLSRLMDAELDRFAAELKNPKKVRSWSLEIFAVSIFDKERPV